MTLAIAIKHVPARYSQAGHEEFAVNLRLYAIGTRHHYEEGSFCNCGRKSASLRNISRSKIGRRMSIQKMQFRCTPRGTT